MAARKLGQVPKACSRCGKGTKIDEAAYCKPCLCDVIEGRAKKALAKTGSDRKPQLAKLAIICSDKSSLACVAAAYLARKLLGSTVTVEAVATANLPKNERDDTTKILAMCADEIATDFLGQFASGGVDMFARASNIFESVTEKELVLYACIKSLKYSETGKSDLKQRIQGIQRRHPGTIEALAQTSRKLQEILAK